MDQSSRRLPGIIADAAPTCAADARDLTARARLRTATHDVHEALHHARPFALIAAGQLDRGGYARLLATLARFHGAMAGALDAAAVALGMPELAHSAQLRRDLLQADLAALGGADAPPTDMAAPTQGDAWAVGCAYTALGSSLGGKVIHRQLEYLCAGTEGRRFFGGSPGDGALCRSFCAALNVYGADPARAPAIADGAAHAFAQFAACLREYS